MESKRSIRLDNAKGALIILVVWGHLIEQAASTSALVAGAYGAIYLFHMPAFALICGMVARATLHGRALRQIATKLLLPLVIFQALYWPALAHVRPGALTDPFAPVWLLWFLLSLATWRLMLPAFVRLPFPFAIALALAVLAGFLGAVDHTFSLSRTVVFFPAFLAGHLYRNRIERLVGMHRPALLALFLALTGAAGVQIATGASVLHLYGSLPFARIPGDALLTATARLVVILAGIAAAVAFLSLVPKRKSWLSALGRHTLPIYLIHGFIVLVFWSATASTGLPPAPITLFLVGAFAVAIAFTISLCAAVIFSSKRLTPLTKDARGFSR